MQNTIDSLLALAGRSILGLYFFVFGGLLKLFNYDGTAATMAEHGMVFVPFFLLLTMLIQFGGGAALIVGYRTQFAAFILAGLTLVINMVIHDFWTLEPGTLQTGHETQNFVKNMGIVGGLLAVAGLGAGQWSLDGRLSKA